MILVVQIAILFFDRVVGLGFYDLGNYNDNDNASPLMRLSLHFLYTVFLSITLYIYSVTGRRDDQHFFKKLNAGLLFFAALIIAFPWPFWVANRFLIYVAFIYLALILARCNGFCVDRAKYNFLIASLVLFNAAAIFMHKGALQMLAATSSAN
jgi:hypothetical protein